METVWVVEQGKYSDYRVVGVYSSQENAQKVCDLLNAEDGPDAYDAASIAEWSLDPAINAINQGMSMWRVQMRRDGYVDSVSHEGLLSYEMRGSFSLWQRDMAATWSPRNTHDILSATVWATDEKHAIKIVNEKRAEWIAMGKWI